MEVYEWLLLAFCAYIIDDVQAYGHTNFILKRLEHCDPNANYSMQLINQTFHTVNQIQYLDGTFNHREPFDNTVFMNTTVEILVIKNTFAYLFSITDKKACYAFHKYMGEFVYDIERAAQLIPKQCPIPAGRRRLHNVALHFEKISLQTFPVGYLRLTTVLTKRNNIFSCMVVELENHV